MTNKEIVQKAFADWQAGAGAISAIFADDMRWTIAGNTLASRTYVDKKDFVDGMLAQFGARFSTPLRPTQIKGVYADGDMVIVNWDGAGIAKDGVAYSNSYVWLLRMRGGLVIDGTAYYDAIAFNDLWTRVAP